MVLSPGAAASTFGIELTVIDAVGPFSTLQDHLPAEAEVADHSGCLITPGFIDTHIHYVQAGVIGAQGHQLLDWLSDFTFIAEQAFADGH